MFAVLLLPLLIPMFPQEERQVLRLEDMKLEHMSQDWASPRAGKSVDGRTLRIGKREFKEGVGTHASSHMRIALDGKVSRFQAWVGVDAEVGKLGTVRFRILGDGKELLKTQRLVGGQDPVRVDLPLTGVRSLVLMVLADGDGINYDHADWAEARFVFAGQPPKAVAPPREPAVILTPKTRPEPKINGARVFGLRPGSPMLFQIPATGLRPMSFAARELPVGLSVDAATGAIRGSVAERGTYEVTLIAKNQLGNYERKLRIVVGDRIALTPPMGWNSWNCWAGAVDEQKIRASAQAMVDSGLINHGWQYINIDDCWMIKRGSKDPILGGKTRDEQGRILCNKRFPDMKGLTGFIHGLGLKAGIYTSPGPWTCAGFEGAWQHEAQDAKSIADWGFDYLKYDWCGYGSIRKKPTLAQMKEPYILMNKLLLQQKRDIVFSLCQYGMGDVSSWGGKVGGNAWRTTGDIRDTWGSMSSIGFRQDRNADSAMPGQWNDPDMLVLGHVGWGPRLHPTKLTPNEQYTHMSLWCLLSAPLLLGNDLARMDEFTLSLLTNDEVIEVNQDPLGKQARPVSRKQGHEVWSKRMEDGSLAVGLFNRDEVAGRVEIDWKTLGLEGEHRVRDLWRQKNLGIFDASFGSEVPGHGVCLLRIFPAAPR
jgi:alpha-galactosidase